MSANTASSIILIVCQQHRLSGGVFYRQQTADIHCSHSTLVVVIELTAMGHQQSKIKKDFHEQRKVLVDDILKVEKELKDFNKRKSELAAKEGDDDINEEDHIHEENEIKKLHTKGFKWPDPDPNGGDTMKKPVPE